MDVSFFSSWLAGHVLTGLVGQVTKTLTPEKSDQVLRRALSGVRDALPMDGTNAQTVVKALERQLHGPLVRELPGVAGRGSARDVLLAFLAGLQFQIDGEVWVAAEDFLAVTGWTLENLADCVVEQTKEAIREAALEAGGMVEANRRLDVAAQNEALLRIEGIFTDGRRDGRREPWSQAPWAGVPVPAEEFVGRESDLRRFAERGTADRQVRVVCLVSGIGGIGKTALVIEYADRVKDEFPDGRVFLDFGSYTGHGRRFDAELALREVLTKTCPTLPREELEKLDIDGLQQVWHREVDGRRVLMVWDNVAELAQIEPLIVRQDGCLTLITSRTNLDLPQATPLPLDVLDADDAAELFIRAAKSGQVLERDLAERLAAADLHMPLLIEQHGRMLSKGHRTLVELVAEVERMPRHGRQAVYERLDLSYQQLGPDLQQVFRLLGVHPGKRLTSATAARLLDRPVDEVIGLFDGLVTAGLARRALDVDSGGVPALYTYTAHDVLLDYANQLAAQHVEELASVRQTLVDYYLLRFVEFSDSSVDLAWFVAEHSLVLAVVTAVESTSQAAALARHLGYCQLATGQMSLANRAFRAAEAIARELGDRVGVTGALRGRVITERTRDRSYVEDYLFKQAVHWSSEPPQQEPGFSRGLALWGKANTLLEMGLFQDAAGLYQEAEAYFRAYDYLSGLAGVLWGRAEVERLQGQYAEADELYKEAEGIFRGLVDRRALAAALHGQADVARAQSRFHDAERLYQEAVETFRQVDDRRGLAETLREQADLARAQGLYQDAECLYREAEDVSRGLGDLLGLVASQWGRVAAVRAQGQHQDADDLHKQTMKLALDFRRDSAESSEA